jgi:hypothetical protein
MDNESYRQEVMSAWGAALAGLVFAVMVWSGRDAMNFVYTWVPQAVILIVMFLVKACFRCPVDW